MLSISVQRRLKSTTLLLSNALNGLRYSRRLIRAGVRRKAVCFVLVASLPIVPGPGLPLNEVRTMASIAENMTVSSLHNLWRTFRFLPWLRADRQRPQPETLAERAAAVARLQISPVKFVGYAEQAVPFTALPLNLAGETIQGVRLTWESSDDDRVEIDDSGQAFFHKPGRATIICRAGTVEATAQVLVRPGRRPLQTDEEWRTDQSSFNASGTTIGGSGGFRSGAGLWPALLAKLMPTVHAQNDGYSNNDFPFDELYSESRNLLGSPRNRAIESIRTGTVLPEGSNNNMAKFRSSGWEVAGSLPVSRFITTRVSGSVTATRSPSTPLRVVRVRASRSGSGGLSLTVQPTQLVIC